MLCCYFFKYRRPCRLSRVSNAIDTLIAAVSPRARLNLGPEVAGQRREFSTRDLHTEADGDERQY